MQSLVYPGPISPPSSLLFSRICQDVNNYIYILCFPWNLFHICRISLFFAFLRRICRFFLHKQRKSAKRKKKKRGTVVFRLPWSKKPSFHSKRKTFGKGKKVKMKEIRFWAIWKRILPPLFTFSWCVRWEGGEKLLKITLREGGAWERNEKWPPSPLPSPSNKWTTTLVTMYGKAHHNFTNSFNYIYYEFFCATVTTMWIIFRQLSPWWRNNFCQFLILSRVGVLSIGIFPPFICGKPK